MVIGGNVPYLHGARPPGVPGPACVGQPGAAEHRPSQLPGRLQSSGQVGIAGEKMPGSWEKIDFFFDDLQLRLWRMVLENS